MRESNTVLDSGFQLLVAFQVSRVEFQVLQAKISQIPNSAGKTFLESWFFRGRQTNKQKIKIAFCGCSFPYCHHCKRTQTPSLTHNFALSGKQVLMWNFEGRGTWAVTQKPKLIQHYVWHPFMLFSIELDFNLKNSILQRTPNSLPSASNLLTYFWRRVYSLTVFLVKWSFQSRLRECLSKKSSQDFWNKTQHQYSVG